MDMEKMMELLLAKMNANQARMEADAKAWREKLKAETEAIRARTKAMRDKRMMEEMMVANHATRFQGEEPTSVDTEPEVAHQEVPRKDAAMMPVGGPRKRRRDWNLAAERRQKPKETARKSVDPGRKRPSPIGRCPVVQQWHDGGETPSGRNGSRARMGAGRNWSSPAEGRPAVGKWHGA
jgi:hypothetical protein